MKIAVFYAICVVIWLLEVWVSAKTFKIQKPQNYLFCFFCLCTGSAILHYLGVHTTYAHYPTVQAFRYTLIGVSGFDGIQMIVLTIGYVLAQSKRAA